ncbi:MAG: SET domain-containing protein-lysine N-methyltransferase [Anaerolineae bacterium]|nr:SET domain-containing protein-lysine N-methyltransferase [Anaerolineae bacterium]
MGNLHLLPSSYMSPKLQVRLARDKGGYGLFAHIPIQQDELLIVWGGTVVHAHDLKELEIENIKIVQIEEDLYSVSDRNGPGDYINHCCDPNAYVEGSVSVRAMRDIPPDEEVCYDYGTTHGSSFDNFHCACGTPHCRGGVTGDDWQRPELQTRYAGYFSSYLQRRIDALKTQQQSVLATNGHSANG